MFPKPPESSFAGRLQEGAEPWPRSPTRAHSREAHSQETFPPEWPKPIAAAGRTCPWGQSANREKWSPSRLALELGENEARLLSHDRDQLIVDGFQLTQARTRDIIFGRDVQRIELAHKLLYFGVECFKLAVVHRGRGLVGFLQLGPAFRLRYRQKPLLEAPLTFAIERSQSLSRLIDLHAKDMRVALIRRMSRIGENRNKNSNGRRRSDLHSQALAPV